MSSFIKKIADYLIDNNLLSQNTTIIFPNKRAGVFLKKSISDLIEKPIYSPKILSIQDWIFELSNFNQVPNIDLLLELYSVHSKIEGDNFQAFETFSNWANILLSDFDEIDKALADSDLIFRYLSEAKRIQNWNNNSEGKKINEAYLKFYNSLPNYYSHYKNELKKKNKAYAGMAFRNISENKSIVFKEKSNIILAGFNALNQAELDIFKYLIDEKKAISFWDIDNFYFNGPSSRHEAAFFLKRSLKELKIQKPNWINDDFKKKKEIKIIGASGNVNQTKIAGACLQNEIESGIRPEKIALILADENLLIPLLGSVSSENEYNITMSYGLRNSNVFSFLNKLFDIFKNPLNRFDESEKEIYYKDFLDVIYHPIINLYISKNFDIQLNSFLKNIYRNNISFVSKSDIESFLSNIPSLNFLIKLIFPDNLKPEYLVQLIIDSFKSLSELVVKKESNINRMEISFISKLIELSNVVNSIISHHNLKINLKSLSNIYKSLSFLESIPFKGEPIKGVQIMGLLETRALDFDSVILLSANEGHLPKRFDYQSFLLFELRKNQKMALPKDKEDITAYYFYRLIQAASKIYLIYNTQTDKFGAGEPSRYIAQIRQELSSYSPNAKITEELFQNRFISPITNEIEIEKTNEIIEILKEKFKYGFSPSSLSTYISCSLKFYFSKIIGIQESDIVEEDIELNTLGTAIHETLRFIFEDFGGKDLIPEDFKLALSNLDRYLKKGFAEAKISNNLMKSKNLISYEIAKEMVTKLIKQDMDSVRNNNNLKIELIENEILVDFAINANNEVYHGNLKGIVDRVDSYNNQIRVIDYKTGNVDFNTKGEIASDSEKLQIGIFEDQKIFKEKAFQLLFYSYLFKKTNKINSPLVSAIYALKHKSRLVHLDFNKSKLLNEGEYFEFEEILKKLISEIFDKNKLFEQTENSDVCKYCDYKFICNKLDE